MSFKVTLKKLDNLSDFDAHKRKPAQDEVFVKIDTERVKVEFERPPEPKEEESEK